MLLQVQPVIPSQNVERAVEFYVQKLGFSLIALTPQHPAYAVIRRDQVELHVQWHDSTQWGDGDRPMLRFLVADIHALFNELAKKGVFHERTALRDTPWQTREFAFYDCDGNGLTFYCDHAVQVK